MSMLTEVLKTMSTNEVKSLVPAGQSVTDLEAFQFLISEAKALAAAGTIELREVEPQRITFSKAASGSL